VTSPVLFCRKVREGRLESAKQFVHNCIHNKSQDYIDLLKRYDLNDTRFWFYGSGGQSFMLFTHDVGPDGFSRLESWEASKHPFDAWFNDQLNDTFVTEDPAQPEYFDGIETS